MKLCQEGQLIIASTRAIQEVPQTPVIPDTVEVTPATTIDIEERGGVGRIVDNHARIDLKRRKRLK
jgi:hypothetical protein